MLQRTTQPGMLCPRQVVQDPSAAGPKLDRRRCASRDAMEKEPTVDTRLQVRNLETSATDDDLRALFARAGEVLAAWIVRDPLSGASHGYGFVIMSAVSEADAAVSRLNDRLFHGRALKVTLS